MDNDISTFPRVQGKIFFWPVALYAVLIVTMVFILEPARSALVNSAELHSDVGVILKALVAPWFIGSVLLAIVALVIAWKIPERTLGILVAVSVALWLQNNVFVWHYGEMDGTAIDWKEHVGKGWIEVVAWLGLVLAGCLYARKIAPHWKSVAVVLLLVQGVGIASAALERQPHGRQAPPGAARDDIEFNLYSRDKNVIVIVLDGLQSDIFAQALGDPDTSSILPPGFVYYRNAISLYVRTQFSIPSILSGESVPGGGNIRQWLTETIQTWVSTRLAEAGWDAYLTSFSSFLNLCKKGEMQRCIHPSAILGSSSESGSRRVERQEASEIFLLSLFRSVPHVMKPMIYRDGKWQVAYILRSEQVQPRDPRILEASRLDLDVLDRLILDARSGDIAPQFRFIHLFGLHFPTRLGQDCGYPENGDKRDRAQLVDTTHCLMRKMREYLHKLDELGVYDNSFIAIVADHGTPDKDVDYSGVIPPVPELAAGTEVYLDDTFRGLPLFLIKDFNAREPIRVSDQPVSLCDIPATVYQAVGLSVHTNCQSVLDDTTNRPPRSHYRYATYNEQKAMTPEERNNLEFRRYVVDGHSWRPGSWKPEREK